MSRAIAAAELQEVIEQLQTVCARGERLAAASGGLVDPKYFRGAASMAVMAMGDLDQKGLYLAKSLEAG